MAENHKFIQGPKKAKGTGMIYYLEKYDTLGLDDDDENASAEESAVNKMFD